MPRRPDPAPGRAGRRREPPEPRNAAEAEQDAAMIAAEKAARAGDDRGARRKAAPPGDGRGALDSPSALPAGLPDRTVLTQEQRRRLRAQRKKEQRRAGRSGAGKTAEAGADAMRARAAQSGAGPAEQEAELRVAHARTITPPPSAAPPSAPSAPAQGAAPAARTAARTDIGGDDAAAVFAEIQAEQAMRVAELQRDIARRRRRRGFFLILRLLLFVIGPTALFGWFQYKVATDLYVSQSAFVVRSASEPPGAEGGLAAALGGAGPMGAIQDSISVQDFILSREALDRLERELSLSAIWTVPDLDPLVRLAPDATREEALDHYRRQVSVGYDPAESLIRMEVAAPDPDAARQISEALISYAEGMVDGLSTRMRRDMVAEAAARAEAARTALTEAHAAEARLKTRLKVFSAEAEAGGERNLIATLDAEREALRGRLSALLDHAPPDDPRAASLRAAIAQREAAIEERRARLFDPGAAQAPSIAEAEAELARARAETVAREQMFLAAQTALETARVEADRQISYLAVIVPPARADAATRPRRAANTALAGLAAFGVYLFASLTVSVLREQFSA